MATNAGRSNSQRSRANRNENHNSQSSRPSSLRILKPLLSNLQTLNDDSTLFLDNSLFEDQNEASSDVPSSIQKQRGCLLCKKRHAKCNKEHHLRRPHEHPYQADLFSIDPSFSADLGLWGWPSIEQYAERVACNEIPQAEALYLQFIFHNRLDQAEPTAHHIDLMLSVNTPSYSTKHRCFYRLPNLNHLQFNRAISTGLGHSHLYSIDYESSFTASERLFWSLVHLLSGQLFFMAHLTTTLIHRPALMSDHVCRRVAADLIYANAGQIEVLLTLFFWVVFHVEQSAVLDLRPVIVLYGIEVVYNISCDVEKYEWVADSQSSPCLASRTAQLYKAFLSQATSQLNDAYVRLLRCFTNSHHTFRNNEAARLAGSLQLSKFPQHCNIYVAWKDSTLRTPYLQGVSLLDALKANTTNESSADPPLQTAYYQPSRLHVNTENNNIIGRSQYWRSTAHHESPEMLSVVRSERELQRVELLSNPPRAKQFLMHAGSHLQNKQDNLCKVVENTTNHRIDEMVELSIDQESQVPDIEGDFNQWSTIFD